MSSFAANLFKSSCNSSSIKEDRILEALVCFRNDIIEEIVKLRQLLITSVLHGNLLEASNSENALQPQVVTLLNEALQEKVSQLMPSVTQTMSNSNNQYDSTHDDKYPASCHESSSEIAVVEEDEFEVVQQDDEKIESELQSNFNDQGCVFTSAEQLDYNVKTEVSENIDFNFDSTQPNVSDERMLPSSSASFPDESGQDVSLTEDDFILSSDAHIETHVFPVIDSSGKQLFGCVECGKAFPYRSGLEKHFRIHTGVKPYKCKICGKSFSQKGSLKYHIDIHTGQKRHKCKTCGKSFVHKGNLNYHVKTHLRSSYHDTDKPASPHSSNLSSTRK